MTASAYRHLLAFIFATITLCVHSLALANDCDRLLGLEANAKSFSEKLWSKHKEEIRQFILSARAQKNLKGLLSTAGTDLDRSLREKFGANLGFHFNLHGGQADSYLVRGGISATQGDSGINGGFSRDFNSKVYFFRHNQFSILDVLSARNPDIILFKIRFGTVLVLFDLNSPELISYRNRKIISKDAPSYVDLDKRIAEESREFFGIPKNSFVLPPIEVFEDIHSRLDFGWLGLSWDEKTYAAILFLTLIVRDLP